MTTLVQGAIAATLSLGTPEALDAYIHPEKCNSVDAPLSAMADCESYVSGLYYNIYLPVERQNKNEPELIEYFSKYLAGETPDFLTPAQFKTLSSYALSYAPINAIVHSRLAPLTEQALQEGKSIDQALATAKEKIENESLPRYRLALEQLKQLRSVEKEGSAMCMRFTYLINSVEECVTNLTNSLSRAMSAFKRNYNDRGTVRDKVEPSTLSEEEQKLARFEHRRKVMVQEIKNIRDKVLQGASFLALQEATPDAVVELQEDLKHVYPTWISFNNVTGKPTEPISEEEVFGESSTFTSTLALSPELQVQHVALAKLPSTSGIHQRMILGVEVVNTKTNRKLAIFTTHTEHVPASYHDTVVKVHEFVTAFTQQNPNIPIVFGGDLNAFEGAAGGAKFIQEMREGPFAGGADYREGDQFFVHKSITDSTYIGIEGVDTRYKFKDGILAPNALDHILTKNVTVAAGTRSAVVYDEQGKLVDPYMQPEVYQKRLEKRKTASDHFLNVVIFHD
jgi:endonuclease/exonuclease/phosphatase family metal-dependent hydrolase